MHRGALAVQFTGVDIEDIGRSTSRSDFVTGLSSALASTSSGALQTPPLTPKLATRHVSLSTSPAQTAVKTVHALCRARLVAEHVFAVEANVRQQLLARVPRVWLHARPPYTRMVESCICRQYEAQSEGRCMPEVPPRDLRRSVRQAVCQVHVRLWHACVAVRRVCRADRGAHSAVHTAGCPVSATALCSAHAARRGCQGLAAARGLRRLPGVLAAVPPGAAAGRDAGV